MGNICSSKIVVVQQPNTVAPEVSLKSKMTNSLSIALKLKVIETSIPCGTPFIKTYKYYCETLSALRISDLDTKLIKI